MKDRKTNDIEKIAETYNAWSVILGDKARLGIFSISVETNSSNSKSIQKNDAFMIVEEQDDNKYVIAIARIFRKRSTLETTTFYFDSFIKIEPRKFLNDLGIPPISSALSINRLEWTLFEGVLKKTLDLAWQAFPVLSGDTTDEQAYIRDLLQKACVDDLLGPADGPYEEIIGMSVRDRYLVGKLAPMSPAVEGPEGFQDQSTKEREKRENDFKPYEGHHQPGEEFSSTEGTPDPDGGETHEVNATINQSLVPSSLGFTFCVDAAIGSVELRASWGRYERADSEQADEKTGKTIRCWKRIPSGGSVTIPLKKRKIEPIVLDTNCPEVIVQGTASAPLPNNDRLVTLFFVNGQALPEQNRDSAWVFQPELIVRDSENRPIFRKRPVYGIDGSDIERASLEM